jgi:hypothetical protein
MDVINAIADELDIKEDKREAAFGNLLHSKRFVRHCQLSLAMPQTPVLRFSMNNYLDMNDNVWPNCPQGFPMMCWQLAINTTKKGRTPEIPLDDWDALPHNNNEEGWQPTTSAKNTQLFTWQEQNEPNRWLVLYHPVYLLDGRTDLFINAWKKVARRVRNNTNFTKEACARDFDFFG